METRLGGPQWDAEGCRYLGQRHPQEVVQDDDRAPVRIEVLERLVQQLAVGDDGRHVGHSRTVDRCQLDLDRSAPPSTRDIDAGMDDELAQPGVELVGVAKRRQVPPCADESILDRVSRELRVPEDQPGGRVQPRDGRAGERGEGVMIAPLCPFDEVSLVHDSPWSLRNHSVALTW